MFLRSLPERELRSGFAEVVKHCVIGDREKWEEIRHKSVDEQEWESLIRHSVAFKTSVVAKDPVEKGLRKILNFGHTIGHALETCSLGTGHRLFHGEAIAAGMIAESFISRKLNLLPEPEEQEIRSYLRQVYGPIVLPEAKDFMPVIRQDKKNAGSKILMALPERIGSAIWDVEVSEELVEEALLSLAV
jgi:3-dehydroquinate synthase